MDREASRSIIHTTGRLALSIFAAASIQAQTVIPVYEVTGTAAHDQLGISVAAVGDVDGDGTPDFITGAHEGNLRTGEATLRSGATGAPILHFLGTAYGDRFGVCVDGAGDVDGDGIPDVIIGAHRADVSGLDSGCVFVYSGADGTELHRFLGTSTGDECGTSVAGAGDLDRDGYADLLVGTPLADTGGTDSGEAIVFSGRDGSILHRFVGDSPHDWFGYSVQTAGDVDGDGYPDVIVGACYDDSPGRFNDGSATVFSGRTGAVLHKFRGRARSDWFGTSVASIGDVDGDGRPDLAVGSPNADISGLNAGAVDVFSGADGRLIYTLAGTNPGDEFGVSVRGAGRFDGDAIPDLVVGAYRDSSVLPGAGSVYVYSGYDGQLLGVHRGKAAHNRMGIAVCGIGDINGDGRDDVAAGEVYVDGVGPDSGAVHVLCGQPQALTTDVPALVASTGGAQNFTLNAGSSFRRLNYLIIGSATGTSPGMNFGNGFVLPVTFDSYGQATVDYANTSTFTRFRGRLDNRGQATAQLNIPPLDASFVGRTFYHAFVVYTKQGAVRMVSNFTTVTLTQ